MPRRLGFAICLAILCLAVVPAANLQDQQPPIFRAGIDVVQLDVSVLDRDRRPVKGLTTADFTVLENGIPQPIVAFDAVEIPDAVVPAARWIRDAPHDVVTNESADRRIVVIVFDDYNMPAEAIVPETARQVARAIVDHLGPQDLASVVFTDSGRRQNVTTDRASLRAAIDSLAPHPPDPGSINALSNALYNRPPSVTMAVRSGSPSASPGPCAWRGPYHSDFSCVIDTFVSVSDALLAAPTGRKTLVYISPGIPYDFSATDLRGWENPTEDILALQKALRSLQRANVDVYAIDPSGVIAGIMGPRQDSLRVLAEENGGRVTLDSNTPWDAVPQIFRENSFYYLIGFRSTNTAKDGRFRSIKVKVNRADLDVRTRSGYFAPMPDPAKPPKNVPPPVDPVETSLGQLVAGGDLRLAMSVAPLAIPGQSATTLAIAVALREAPGPGVKRMDLVATALDDDCLDCRQHQVHRQTIELRPASPRQTSSAVESFSRLTVPPGRYNVRVAARIDDRVGNVFTDIEVPAFGKEKLSASGIVLSTGGVNLTGSKTDVSDVLPVVPTALREFVSGDRVTAFVRLYQAGVKTPAAVQVQARVLDGAEHVNFEQTTSLEADAHRGLHWADYRVDLPIKELDSGPHLLSVEARVKDLVVTRTARFAVR
jgi:VWFA-related protein